MKQISYKDLSIGLKILVVLNVSVIISKILLFGAGFFLGLTGAI